jgi:hypothetical protein
VKVGPAVKRLQESETDLAEQFREVGERHPSEHDLYHLAHRFATECEHHAERLAPIAERYGTEPADVEAGEGGLFEALRGKTGALLGRRPESGVLLLRDLRELYPAAQETLITWIIVNQGAMAARDQELLEVAKECVLETDLQVKWLVTRIKVTAPQVLAS